jgi:hypothetical protein
MDPPFWPSAACLNGYQMKWIFIAFFAASMIHMGEPPLDQFRSTHAQWVNRDRRIGFTVSGSSPNLLSGGKRSQASIDRRALNCTRYVDA